MLPLPATVSVMPLQPILSGAVIAANMAEHKPALCPQEARIEAHRCLYCFDAPCIMACPAGVDVPAFIRQIAHGNPAAAARTILGANVLGASCARVCPTAVLCEAACVLDDRDHHPMQIGRLQRFATDHIRENGIDALAAPASATGKRIAVIGAGPAGLACAAELAQLGHTVVVFEKRAQPGGLNTYGIAYYKMRPEVALAEAELVRSLGVEIRLGVAVGEDVPVAELERDFDAIFIGIGLGAMSRLCIPGEELPEVVDALDFIATIRSQPLTEIPLGRRVVVVGAGNTAIDAVTQSLRLGAEQATIAYRRTQADMPAYDFEYTRAKDDGARFLFNVLPVEVLGSNGHVTGLRLVRSRANADGRPEPIPGTEFVEPCDLVLKANGQDKLAGLLRELFPALAIDPHGLVVRDALSGQTSLPRVFAGGDCASGGREVVNAVGEGKKAARGIHSFLTRQTVPPPVQSSRLGATNGPRGSGLLHPIRVRELEAAMSK